MSLLVYLLSIVALDLIGLFFNVRMLLSCCRKENKYLTPWIICQFVFQVTILTAVTVDAWNRNIDEYYEYCCLLKGLNEKAAFLAIYNMAQLVAVTLDEHDRRFVSNIRTTSPVLLVSAALVMTITNVSVLWSPLQEFSENSASAVYLLVVLNFLVPRFLFSFSGARKNYCTEPEKNNYSTMRLFWLLKPCLIDAVCFSVGMSLSFGLIYTILIPFHSSIEQNLLAWHYIAMVLMNIGYGVFFPGLVKYLIEFKPKEGDKIGKEGSLHSNL